MNNTQIHHSGGGLATGSSSAQLKARASVALLQARKRGESTVVKKS